MDETKDECLIYSPMDCGDPRAKPSGLMQQLLLPPHEASRMPIHFTSGGKLTPSVLHAAVARQSFVLEAHSHCLHSKSLNRG